MLLVLGSGAVYNLDVGGKPVLLGHEISAVQLDEVAMEIVKPDAAAGAGGAYSSVREPVASLSAASGGRRHRPFAAANLKIMLDEPTAALGVARTAEVLNLIERVFAKTRPGVIIIGLTWKTFAPSPTVSSVRLGRNKGIFTPDASNQDLVAAIWRCGATENLRPPQVERKITANDFRAM